ncbi:hypothetical protein AB0H97_24870 [Streptomyces sp. NPDC050788]
MPSTTFPEVRDRFPEYVWDAVVSGDRLGGWLERVHPGHPWAARLRA